MGCAVWIQELTRLIWHSLPNILNLTFSFQSGRDASDALVRRRSKEFLPPTQPRSTCMGPLGKLISSHIRLLLRHDTCRGGATHWGNDWREELRFRFFSLEVTVPGSMLLLVSLSSGSGRRQSPANVGWRRLMLLLLFLCICMINHLDPDHGRPLTQNWTNWIMIDQDRGGWGLAWGRVIIGAWQIARSIY